MHQLSFHPISMASVWTDRRQNMRQRVSMPILLPSGIGVGDVTVCVSDDGSAIIVEVTWPDALLDPEHLLSVFINSDTYPSYTVDHAEVLSLETTLKQFRTSIGAKRSDPIKSKCRIQLPFQAESSDIESVVIPCKSKKAENPESNVLLVRLFAVEDEYDDSNSSKRPKLLVDNSDKS